MQLSRRQGARSLRDRAERSPITPSSLPAPKPCPGWFAGELVGSFHADRNAESDYRKIPRRLVKAMQDAEVKGNSPIWASRRSTARRKQFVAFMKSERRSTPS